jgi:hypothetical protein
LSSNNKNKDDQNLLDRDFCSDNFTPPNREPLNKESNFMATDIDDDEYVEINSKLEDEVQSLFLRNKNLSKNLYWAGLNQQIQQENVQG